MHYKVFVIGNDVDGQLEPFGWDYGCYKRKVAKVTDEEKQKFLDYYNEGDDFEEVYAKRGHAWNSETWEKDVFGVWYEFSWGNPNARWDWYDKLGGRWKDELVLKDGTSTYQATIKEVDWDKTSAYCYAIVADGEWIDLNDATGDEARVLLERVDEEQEITIVDLHN